MNLFQSQSYEVDILGVSPNTENTTKPKNGNGSFIYFSCQFEIHYSIDAAQEKLLLSKLPKEAKEQEAEAKSTELNCDEEALDVTLKIIEDQLESRNNALEYKVFEGFNRNFAIKYLKYLHIL